METPTREMKEIKQLQNKIQKLQLDPNNHISNLSSHKILNQNIVTTDSNQEYFFNSQDWMVNQNQVISQQIKISDIKNKDYYDQKNLNSSDEYHMFHTLEKVSKKNHFEGETAEKDRSNSPKNQSIYLQRKNYFVKNEAKVCQQNFEFVDFNKNEQRTLNISPPEPFFKQKSNIKNYPNPNNNFDDSNNFKNNKTLKTNELNPKFQKYSSEYIETESENSLEIEEEIQNSHSNQLDLPPIIETHQNFEQFDNFAGHDPELDSILQFNCQEEDRENEKYFLTSAKQRPHRNQDILSQKKNYFDLKYKEKYYFNKNQSFQDEEMFKGKKIVRRKSLDGIETLF